MLYKWTIGALIVLLLCVAASLAIGAERNFVANGDFSAVNQDTAKPNGWKFSIKAGQPTYRVIKEGDTAHLRITVAAGDGARLSQSLPLLPEHYYSFRCEYRIQGRSSAQPNVAVRIAANTKKDLWRIWDYSKPEPSTEWRPLELEFVVPSNITGRKVGLTYFINNNRNAGTIELRNIIVVEKPLTAYQRQNTYTATDGSVYFPQQAEPTPAEPALPDDVKSQPMFWWTGAEADGVGPGEIIDINHVNQPLSVSLAGGGDDSRVLVLEANRPLKGLNIQLANLPASVTATLEQVDIWRQRMGYRSGFYDWLPERLLDPPAAVDLAPHQRLQLFLRFKAGASAQSGRAVIRIQQNGRTIFQVPIDVKMLPFDLPTDTPQPIWGLYPDPGRWNSFTPQAMDRELKWLHDCGIRTLLLYMPLESISTSEPLTDRNLAAGLAAWRTALEQWGDRYMDHFIKAGFGPVWVCNVQSLPRRLAKASGLKRLNEEEEHATYNPKLLGYLRRYVEVIEQVRKERGWPEFYYHLVDEPGSKTNVAAVAEYSILQDLKLKGYTTANTKTVVRDFRDSVDLFAISSGIFVNPAELAHIQNWLSDYPHAQLWWYGAAGAYSGQDGHLSKNRFGMGFFTWLIGAKGGFLWTYQRVFGSAFNDFDGVSKDMCLTYPPEDPARRHSGKAISTLQWEGIRDGMTDYRYLQLLDRRLKAASQRGMNAETESIAAEVDAFRQMLWKQSRDEVSNRILNQWRDKVAQWIDALKARPTP